MIFASPRASLSGGEHCKSPPRDVEDDKSDTCTEVSPKKLLCSARRLACRWNAEGVLPNFRCHIHLFPLMRNGHHHRLAALP